MMNKWHKRNNLTRQPGVVISLLITLLVVTGFFIYHNNNYYYSLTDKEQQMVSKLLQQPETRYFGYYSVALPAEFTPAPEMFMFIQGSDMTKIESKKQYYPPFEQFLKRYKNELDNTLPVRPDDAPFLKQIHLLPSGMKGEIFERMEHQGVPDVARILEAYRWDDGVTFKIEMKASDGRAKKYDEDRKKSKYSFNYDIPERKSLLLSILSGLHPRKDNQRPQENNLAIKYGEVKESLLGEYEMTVKYLNKYGIEINFSMDNGPYRETPLLKKDHRVMESSYGTTLYKGSRKVNGFDAVEWLVRENRVSEGIPMTSYTFTLIINEDRVGGVTPLEVNMIYTSHEKSSDELLSESELVAAWQHITETLEYHKSW
ncbi:T6SS immunity protein Tli4 family protein [Klebsiella quasipneumoniae]|uniref:T6SS immunity protein Tli4 family protein n=1 Tax=Klebsiella quasipneumoniae TaxID=1463165 RepID=UPI0024063F61|nr:T6SS immunity protein Tli4 family protein [Klebsiella quasipneumoniae]MDG0760749.1 T6SS immunity protein Tli4 family protein [Klebsiella quasipneumoniae]